MVVGRRRRRRNEGRQGWVEVGLAVSAVLGVRVEGMVASSSSVGSGVVPLVQGGGLSRDEDGAGTERGGLLCFFHSFIHSH